jgi:hypothetical protein
MSCLEQSASKVPIINVCNGLTWLLLMCNLRFSNYLCLLLDLVIFITYRLLLLSYIVCILSRVRLP